ncbi:MAG: hypothetical protein ACI4NM_12340 [Bullifex sp.]
MKRIIVLSILALLLVTACDPVAAPDVQDTVNDILNQEPKPDEKPPADVPPAETPKEDTPPADNKQEETPPAETVKEEADILKPIVGKDYTVNSGSVPCIIDNLPVFDIQILKTEGGYRLKTDVGLFDITKAEDGKYMVEEYVISVSEDGMKVTIGDAVYEGT